MDKRLYRQRTIVNGLHQRVPGKEKKMQARLLLTLLFFLFLWLLLTFVRSDFFRLEVIVIHGHVHTPEAEIRAALQVKEGANIWKISPALLQQRVEAIPRVSSAEIKRRLPRKILVTVREEQVLILVPYQEHLLELSMDGQVLGSTRERHNYGLPLLTGSGPVEISVGKTLLEGQRLAAVREIMALLADSKLHVSELNLADPENLVLVTMDGLVVWLGNGEYAGKVGLLQQISSQLQNKKTGGYLDLRVKEAPVFASGKEADES